MSDIRVDALHLHPVKACRRVEVSEARVVATGLAHDRVWQVVDADGGCVTQRNHAALATVDTAIDGDDVVVSAPGRGEARLTREGARPATIAPLVGRPIEGVDGGDEAAGWLSEFIGADLRFAAVTDSTDRRAPRSLDVYEQPLTFVDLAPVLLASQSSLRWLQERAAEPFGMDRFRANIIVDGAAPWAEDTWREMTIGDVSLTGELPWPRCAVPQVDQDSGERRREPALALRAHRWCTEAPSLEGNQRAMMEGNGLFGMSCRIGPVGSTVAVGDVLTVHSTQDPVLAPPA